jgi:phosphatidylglycerophosphate synthase
MQSAQPTVMAIGTNMTPIWGMSAAERVRRLAGKLGLPFGTAPGPNSDGGPEMLVNVAFAVDPPLFNHMAKQPDHVLLDEGRRPVIAHLSTSGTAAGRAIGDAMASGAALGPELGLTEIVHREGFTLYNHELRKREQPFLMPLTPATVPAIERASYYAAYKGVTDILTKYLWPEWALVLTRLAARIGATPNMVTAVGALLCVAATFLFWHGAYWWGIAAGLVFMVLDTVDGKLARCTITSSKWGNVFDHGIDLVHPPFWWWAWAVGLHAWELGYSDEKFALVMAAILGGYIVQRLIEGAFMRLFGMHIHVWQRIDSQFRLITARRNPNMVILFAALIFSRPDIGLELVAWWTILSCLFHAVRLAQAMRVKARGGEVQSWLG